MKLKQEMSEGLQLLAEKHRALFHEFTLETVTNFAAFKKYLEILQDTEYAYWYWEDRREVLNALRHVLQQIRDTETSHALEATCVRGSKAS